MGYEPRSGEWDEGDSAFDDVRRWRTPIADELFLQVAVAEPDVFVLSRVDYAGPAPVHTLPGPADLQRIQRDFRVHAWRIRGDFPVAPPSTGRCLCAVAVAEN